MATATPIKYTVKAGDTLSKIASQYGVGMSSISGYRSGDPNKIGVGEVLTFTPNVVPPANTINAGDLAAKSFSEIPSPVPVAASGLNGLIQASMNRALEFGTKVKQGEERIEGVYDRLKTKARERADLYETEGVNDAQRELQEIQQSMRAKEQAYIAKVDRIRNSNPTGALAAGQDIELDRISKDHSIERSADAITLEAKLGNYNTAKSIVDGRIEAETEDLQMELDQIKYLFEKDYDRLTESQRDVLSDQRSAIESELSEKKELLQTIGELQIEAAKNGAPQDVIRNIGSSTDVSSAITNAGSYIGLLERQNILSIIRDRNTNGGGGPLFTNSQLNNGAATAGVPIDTFKGFDDTTKNIFINGDMNGAKKSITDAFDNAGTLDDVISGIGEMSELTEPVKQFLTDYATEQWEDFRPRTAEETQQTLISSFSDLKGQEYTRDEALEAVKGTLTDNGKTAIPEALSRSISKAASEVYGKTTGQKIWSFFTRD